MYLFKKKKLTLREIHKLYLLLKPCLPEKEEELLIDETIRMIEKMSDGMFSKSLKAMRIDTKSGNVLELLILFVDGLQSNNFFDYASFIKGMNAKS